MFSTIFELYDQSTLCANINSLPLCVKLNHLPARFSFDILRFSVQVNSLADWLSREAEPSVPDKEKMGLQRHINAVAGAIETECSQRRDRKGPERTRAHCFT